MTCKRFCLATTGRCGSRSFFLSLLKYDDIAIPSKNQDIQCNELLNPRFLPEFYESYSIMCGQNINTKSSLIDWFYLFNNISPYAGFKMLFSQSIDCPDFFERGDIRFIVLLRHDVPSTLASLMLAGDTGVWNREGGAHTRSWSYSSAREEELQEKVRGHYQAVIRLASIKNAIRIYYEDIVKEGFHHAQLSEFFGRDIRLSAPKQATSGAQYVRNWSEFQETVEMMWSRCCGAV